MPDKPATQSPGPESPPRATPDVPPPAKRKRSVLGTMWSVLRTMWSVLRKWMPLAITCLSVALGFWAYKLYPKTSDSPAATYSTLEVTTSVPKIDFVNYHVFQMSPDIAVVRVWVVTSDSWPQVRGPSGTATLRLSLPAGSYFRECPHPACETIETDPYPAGTDWKKKVTFSQFFPGTYVWAARADFFVRARHFGLTFNHDHVSAAIPDIVYKGSKKDKKDNRAAFLGVSYWIPSAASYDWSSLPVDAVAHTKADWSVPMPQGETAGQIAIGVDQAAKRSDEFKLFLAGALAALAGAGLLTALIEALHARDWEALQDLRTK